MWVARLLLWFKTFGLNNHNMTALQLDNLIQTVALDYFRSKGVTVPQNIGLLLVAQAKHETGNYTSHVFVQNRNLFGYKVYPGSSFQTGGAINAVDGGQFARYSSYDNSVREICAWWCRNRAGTTRSRLSYLGANPSVDQYVGLLKQLQYFGDPLSEYLNGMKRFMAAVNAGSILPGVTVYSKTLSTALLIVLFSTLFI
jgi:uncharacterized FlgJ-related protein